MTVDVGFCRLAAVFQAMNETNDVDLVRQFVQGASEIAFTRLVERYGGLVYSTALRIACNPEAARDVTQIVFIDLLRKAARIRELVRKEPINAGPAILAGWLHRAARFEALEFVRSEARRKMRENSPCKIDL